MLLAKPLSRSVAAQYRPPADATMTRPINNKNNTRQRVIKHGNDKFDPSFVARAENYAHLGLTEEEMSECFDVSLPAFKRWKAKHPELRSAIKRGGPEATAHVARTMYLNAIGYEHTEDKIVTHRTQRGKLIVDVIPTVKKYPPNHVSGIFYLKNKDPSRWKDRQELSASDDLKKLIGGWQEAAKRLSLSGDILSASNSDEETAVRH